MSNPDKRRDAESVYEDILVNGWYTGDDCPRCENYILLSNGETDWCPGCSYTRRAENDDYAGEGLA